LQAQHADSPLTPTGESSVYASRVTRAEGTRRQPCARVHTSHVNSTYHNNIRILLLNPESQRAPALRFCYYPDSRIQTDFSFRQSRRRSCQLLLPARRNVSGAARHEEAGHGERPRRPYRRPPRRPPPPRALLPPRALSGADVRAQDRGAGSTSGNLSPPCASPASRGATTLHASPTSSTTCSYSATPAPSSSPSSSTSTSATSTSTRSSPPTTGEVVPARLHFRAPSESGAVHHQRRLHLPG
jgi:hypothetical protein